MNELRSMGARMRATVRDLLASGEVVRAMVVPGDGATLPPGVMDCDFVNLDFGYNMPIPVLDLEVTARGVSGVLSFAGEPFAVDLPWSSMVAVDLRSEALAEAAKAGESTPARKPDPKPCTPPPARGGLRLVKGGPS